VSSGYVLADRQTDRQKENGSNNTFNTDLGAVRMPLNEEA